MNTSSISGNDYQKSFIDTLVSIILLIVLQIPVMLIGIVVKPTNKIAKKIINTYDRICVKLNIKENLYLFTKRIFDIFFWPTWNNSINTNINSN